MMIYFDLRIYIFPPLFLCIFYTTPKNERTIGRYFLPLNIFYFRNNLIDYDEI
jgi:hypothetical protein